jgi:hypothetical protein
MAGVETQRLRIVVDVDPLSVPLEGTLTGASQQQRDFVGLVELLAAVEAAVRSANPEDRVDAGEGALP